MKLNLNIDGYNLQMPLDELYRIIVEYQQQCQRLEGCGQFIKHKVIQANAEFTSENYNRTQEAIDDFLKRLGLMREELSELLQSCKQLMDKLEDIGRPW